MATAHDTLAGDASVGQGNHALNAVGKLIRIKDLELRYAAMATRPQTPPFVLPGGAS